MKTKVYIWETKEKILFDVDQDNQMITINKAAYNYDKEKVNDQKQNIIDSFFKRGTGYEIIDNTEGVCDENTQD